MDLHHLPQSAMILVLDLKNQNVDFVSWVALKIPDTTSQKSIVMMIYNGLKLNRNFGQLTPVMKFQKAVFQNNVIKFDRLV